MTVAGVLAAVALFLSAGTAALGCWNLMLYRTPRAAPRGFRPKLSVLVPARNEEARLGPTLDSVLASRGVDLELIVGDDHSTDGTAELVRRAAARDPRVRLVRPPALPPGWSGKQHVCHFLSTQARHGTLVFLDADVRLAPDALSRIAAFMERARTNLVSGFPRQITESFWEKVVIPQIHFLLIGFLPMTGMRRTNDPGFGAACGQLIAVRRLAYEAAGGHKADRASRHDGVKLPRTFRKAGLRTDLFDATALAHTRMYDSLSGIWFGFRRNATEGMATPKALPVWTVLLAGGQILPPFLLLWHFGVAPLPPPALALAAAATAAVFGFRALLALRFRQSWLGVLLHPLGVAFTLALQWVALVSALRGRTVSWRGREYSAADPG
ncbi:MAG: glycosyltransferase [Alphaproteobacteria bacterium]